MEERKKLEIHVTNTWMIDHIRYFPVVNKQYFTNILHYYFNYPRSMRKMQKTSIIYLWNNNFL